MNFFALMNIHVTTSLPICLCLSAKSGLLASKSLLLEAGLVIYRYFTRLPSRTVISIFNLTSNSTCLLYTHQSGYGYSFCFSSVCGILPVFACSVWILASLKSSFLDAGGNSSALPSSTWGLDCSLAGPPRSVFSNSLSIAFLPGEQD